MLHNIIKTIDGQNIFYPHGIKKYGYLISENTRIKIIENDNKESKILLSLSILLLVLLKIFITSIIHGIAIIFVCFGVAGYFERKRKKKWIDNLTEKALPPDRDVFIREYGYYMTDKKIRMCNIFSVAMFVFGGILLFIEMIALFALAHGRPVSIHAETIIASSLFFVAGYVLYRFSADLERVKAHPPAAVRLADLLLPAQARSAAADDPR